ncbi:MAG: carboxypeptidase-like regulatory domain-containing protein [Dermatophilaceae bacterium]
MGADSGTYRVKFFSDRMLFPMQYYGGATDVTNADIVTLTRPDNLDLGSVTLLAGGTMTGTITLAGGASPAGACVSVASVGGQGSSGGACVGPDGTYTVTGLAAGSYAVTAIGPWDQDYISATYTDPATGSAEATVTEGGTTSGIDLTLALGGAIRGRVTTDTGAPITRASVHVYLPLPDGHMGWPTWAASATTDATGAYVVHSLPPGDYLVEASAIGTVSEVYREATSFAAGTTVTVSAGTSTDGIGFTLSAAHDLYVVASTGLVTLSGIEITVYPVDGTPPVLVGTTDAAGTLVADIVPAGLYKVGCHDPSGRYADTFVSRRRRPRPSLGALPRRRQPVPRQVPLHHRAVWLDQRDRHGRPHPGST